MLEHPSGACNGITDAPFMLRDVVRTVTIPDILSQKDFSLIILNVLYKKKLK